MHTSTILWEDACAMRLRWARQFMSHRRVKVILGLHFNFGAFIVEVIEGQRTVHSGWMTVWWRNSRRGYKGKKTGGKQPSRGQNRQSRRGLIIPLQTQSGEQKEARFTSPTLSSQNYIWPQICDINVKKSGWKWTISCMCLAPKGIYPHSFKIKLIRGIWLAQSVKCATLDLGVVSLSPALGIEIA